MEAVVAKGNLSRSGLRMLFRKKRGLYVIVGIIVLLLIGTIFVLLHLHRSKLDPVGQKKLQTSLQAAENTQTNAAEATVATDTTALISGEKSGKYVIGDGALGTLYFQRAAALLNLNQDREAVSDYQTAIQLNPALRRIGLEGEVEARYALGDRKQLIPLLQQIVPLEEQSSAGQPGSSNTAGIYENAIQALQNNQEVNL